MERVPSEHEGRFKTLSLLSLDGKKGKIYFIIEGTGEENATEEEINRTQRFWVEEHTCPTNFISVEYIALMGNLDPHGLFDHIRTIWMTKEYDDMRNRNFGGDDVEHEVVYKLFPELGHCVEAGEKFILPRKFVIPKALKE